MKGIAILLSAALLVLLAYPVAAQETYYADIGMQVIENGNVVFSGTTNHPGLSAGVHGEYTSKKGSYWLLNISAAGEFSDYVYTVRMPPGSSVNYIKSSGRVSIGHDGDTIKIDGVGQGSGFDIVIQYSIDTPQPAAWWVLPLPVAAALLLVFGGMAAKKKRKAAGVAKGAGASNAGYNPSLLTERQLSIVKALEAAGKPLTQKQIEKELSLPKSSVSRNISSLVRAGILVRHNRGMSNAVWFKEKPGKPAGEAKS